MASFVFATSLNGMNITDYYYIIKCLLQFIIRSAKNTKDTFINSLSIVSTHIASQSYVFSL